MIWAWWTKRSTNAEVSRLSPNMRFHWPNSKFEVTMTLFVHNSLQWYEIGAPLLAFEMVHNLAHLKLINHKLQSASWYGLNSLVVKASSNKPTKSATRKNFTWYPCSQAFKPNAVAKCVFPVPGDPSNKRFCLPSKIAIHKCVLDSL